MYIQSTKSMTIGAMQRMMISPYDYMVTMTVIPVKADTSW